MAAPASGSLSLRNIRREISANNYYGHTSILINNAGITKDNLFLRMKDEE